MQWVHREPFDEGTEAGVIERAIVRKEGGVEAGVGAGGAGEGEKEGKVNEEVLVVRLDGAILSDVVVPVRLFVPEHDHFGFESLLEGSAEVGKLEFDDLDGGNGLLPNILGGKSGVGRDVASDLREGGSPECLCELRSIAPKRLDGTHVEETVDVGEDLPGVLLE